MLRRLIRTAFALSERDGAKAYLAQSRHPAPALPDSTISSNAKPALHPARVIPHGIDSSIKLCKISQNELRRRDSGGNMRTASDPHLHAIVENAMDSFLTIEDPSSAPPSGGWKGALSSPSTARPKAHSTRSAGAVVGHSVNMVTAEPSASMTAVLPAMCAQARPGSRLGARRPSGRVCLRQAA